MVKGKEPSHADERIGRGGRVKAVREKDLNGAAEPCLLGTGEGDKNNSFP